MSRSVRTLSAPSSVDAGTVSPSATSDSALKVSVDRICSVEI